MDDAELILRHRRASLVKAIVKRIRTEVQTAKRFEHRHRGVDKDWKLDRVVQEAQKAGRLPKEPPEQEITVSIFQEDQAAETPSTDAELHHWVEANFDALIRKFLALRRYRKHRAAMRWLQSDTPPDRHRLARRRGISSAAIRHREKQALTDFGLWLHEATRQERPQQHPSAGQK